MNSKESYNVSLPAAEELKSIPIVYLCGPYSVDSVKFTSLAMRIASEFRSHHVHTYVPHLNILQELVQKDYGTEDKVTGWHWWMVNSLAIMVNCDALFVINTSEPSVGRDTEIEYAKRFGMPVFYNNGTDWFKCIRYVKNKL